MKIVVAFIALSIPQLAIAEIMKFNCGLLDDQPISVSFAQVKFDADKKMAKYGAQPWVEVHYWLPNYISWVHNTPGATWITLHTFSKIDQKLMTTSHSAKNFNATPFREKPKNCTIDF